MVDTSYVSPTVLRNKFFEISPRHSLFMTTADALTRRMGQLSRVAQVGKLVNLSLRISDF
jgi:hypothetical protein